MTEPQRINSDKRNRMQHSKLKKIKNMLRVDIHVVTSEIRHIPLPALPFHLAGTESSFLESRQTEEGVKTAASTNLSVQFYLMDETCDAAVWGDGTRSSVGREWGNLMKRGSISDLSNPSPSAVQAGLGSVRSAMT
jgi:hypothetical protein